MERRLMSLAAVVWVLVLLAAGSVANAHSAFNYYSTSWGPATCPTSTGDLPSRSLVERSGIE